MTHFWSKFIIKLIDHFQVGTFLRGKTFELDWSLYYFLLGLMPQKCIRHRNFINAAHLCKLMTNSVTRLGNFLDFGQLFKAFGHNLFPKSTFLCSFIKVSKSLIFLVKSFWATFIDIWWFFTGHTGSNVKVLIDLALHFRRQKTSSSVWPSRSSRILKDVSLKPAMFGSSVTGWHSSTSWPTRT